MCDTADARLSLAWSQSPTRLHETGALWGLSSEGVTDGERVFALSRATSLSLLVFTCKVRRLMPAGQACEMPYSHKVLGGMDGVGDLHFDSIIMASFYCEMCPFHFLRRTLKVLGSVDRDVSKSADNPCSCCGRRQLFL